MKGEQTMNYPSNNALNYRDLAYQKIRGLNYDELLELQTETGLSIQQLEFMYYNL